MSRDTDLEFIEDLMDEFDLNLNQRISKLIDSLASDDEAEDEDEED